MTAPAPEVEIVRPVHDELATRPRYTPGIRAYQRAVDEIQIGVNPRRAVLATDLSPRMVSVLLSLDGQASIGRLMSRVGPQHADRLRALLREMMAAGFVIDANQPARNARLAHATVEIRGDGPLAAAVAVQLASAGIGSLIVTSSGTVGTEDIGAVCTPADLGKQRRHVIEQAISAANPSVDIAPARRECSPDLVILTDALVPAPEVVAQLMQDNQEHLVVAARDGCGIVGPLVLPGRSACLECFDRYRTDRDRCWPRVASQLAGKVQRADPATTQATAAFAAAQVAPSLQPSQDRPPLLEATLELDLTEGATLRREWVAHPLCRCGVANRWDVDISDQPDELGRQRP
ncbi:MULTISPECIES: TOMM precursor leader peptide-binding protein [Thermocrispum]|jgi:bacteriocin biosynthesis cyclodehydratase domain-containing protein|uniref:TOMM leader peptide-binding protein n=1 Tax=Thermocrispum agreste TaxID=37925 RepID=A0A2W4JNR3_9PSEU|nr:MULTISPECIES: TOMM precursor leader peptide-binding protein [Thermocrispum]PZN00663.1 MAG: hypothetical protein DIU77_03070 [Thermocrispum agreste]